MRLGSERAVVANTFATIKDLWVGLLNNLIDKPQQQHGFAELPEYNLSVANMTEPIRRCQKAATRALGKPLWPTYYHLLEPSSVRLTKELLQKGETHLDIYPYLWQFGFVLVLSLTYVPNFASVNLVASAEKERQKRLDMIYAALKKRTTAGEQVDCIVNGLVKDSLPKAAPDSATSFVYLVIGWFSTSEGQEFQDVLYEDILKAYRGDRNKAWDMAFREESVELLVSLCKETLQFWTTTPFAVPRTTVKDVAYAETTIPKGTAMVVNAQQAGRGGAWYGGGAGAFGPAGFVGTFKIQEGGKGARKANTDMLDFSDEYKSLVAISRGFDCRFVARDEKWVGSKI
ncbi:hypothetical protein BDZ45DRAFT_731072 [Acephala macrosclerotiorum]|nr:hypothetical protein BDZ45DRAFT_731072 [Acephala macrosclerotiorum]